MTNDSTAALERLLRANGLDWVFELFDPKERFLAVWIEHLNHVAAKYHELHGVAVSFAPETLELEAAKNPHKIRAFLEAFSVASSPGMLVMVWRILEGLKIRDVHLTYSECNSFELTVVLSGPPPSNEETYVSHDIRDAALLRHFGTSTIDKKPIFHGFYTLASLQKLP
jgi:hypothetical protein